MGPVDEESQTFTMDCYFRQYWQDFRLKFNNRGLVELPMNWQFLTKIWRPDTVFINGKDSYLHKMTVSNLKIFSKLSNNISFYFLLNIEIRLIETFSFLGSQPIYSDLSQRKNILFSKINGQSKMSNGLKKISVGFSIMSFRNWKLWA